MNAPTRGAVRRAARRSAAGALFAALLCAATARADGPSPQEHYKKGMAAYALEDWDAAIAEFEAGFREEPNAAFLYNIAQAHRKAKRPEPAVKFYRKYLELAPDARDRGEVEGLIASLEHAISEQQRALQQPPTGVETPGAPGRPVEHRTATAPSPATEPPVGAEAPRRDVVALALIGGGAALVAAGIGLAVYSSVAGGQARDQTTHLDLDARAGLDRRANGTGIAGYSAIGVGVVLALGGGIKLALERRATRVTWSVGGGPGGVLATVGGRF
jgi:tetratricopeptide (TPR) repeat protein